MKTLDLQWTFESRPAEREEILDMPYENFLDREGHTQEPFLDEEINLFYLPKDHSAFEILHSLTRNVGCLKQETRSLLLKNDIILGVGSNAGKKLDHCPRVKNNCRTGEGYHYCRDKNGCNQIEHAEIMAIYDTLEKHAPSSAPLFLEVIETINKHITQSNEELPELYKKRNQILQHVQSVLDPEEEGFNLLLDGHWWICQSCLSALLSLGVRRIYLKEDASILYNNTHPNNTLPRFNTDGTLLDS